MSADSTKEWQRYLLAESGGFISGLIVLSLPLYLGRRKSQCVQLANVLRSGTAAAPQNCRAHFLPPGRFRLVLARRILFSEKPLRRIEAADVCIGADGQFCHWRKMLHACGDVVRWSAVQQDGIRTTSLHCCSSLFQRLTGEQLSVFGG